MRIEKRTEEIPCGTSEITEYFEGETPVRRDVAIRVTKGIQVGAEDGDNASSLQ